MKQSFLINRLNSTKKTASFKYNCMKNLEFFLSILIEYKFFGYLSTLIASHSRAMPSPYTEIIENECFAPSWWDKKACVHFISPPKRGAQPAYILRTALLPSLKRRRERWDIYAAGMEKKNTKLTPATLPWWPGWTRCASSLPRRLPRNWHWRTQRSRPATQHYAHQETVQEFLFTQLLLNQMTHKAF